ncbi:hypothetical protein K2Z83_11275 [Oscillochloris sp. ZM17-4]|uniref:hypothetical protein n=1 Tax=Oscillochloris sp. ZM17-4 TaxID=2866714 RepID=UPI001C73818C|nr:hypothetical protein [Oscillochloris sp. ZM17-4]MBX0328257.1 hypothetical protein [Oscillochloris sp. ZM17-4]
MATSPQFVAVPNVALTKFTNSDGTNPKAVFTPGSSGSRIHAVVGTSTDTAAARFTVWLVRSGTSYLLDTVTLPAASAITPTTNWSLLDTDWFTWLDPNDPSLILPADVTISIAPAVAVTSGKEVSFLIFGGDF